MTSQAGRTTNAIFEFGERSPNGAAFEGRRIGSSVLLAWRTAGGLDTVLNVIRRISGNALDTDDASLLLRDEDEDGNDEVEGPSGEVYALALLHPEAVLATSIHFPGIHFSWMQARDSDPQTASLCNARFEPYDHKSALSLLGATALKWSAELQADLERVLDIAITGE